MLLKTNSEIKNFQSFSATEDVLMVRTFYHFEESYNGHNGKETSPSPFMNYYCKMFKRKYFFS